MSCDAIREQILTAELGELAGIGNSPVAEHVRSCEECRAAVASIVSATESARGAYGALGPRAAASTALTNPAAIPARAPSRRLARNRNLVGWVIAGIGIAAAVAVAVLPRAPKHGFDPVLPPMSPADTSAAPLAVVVPEGRNAIVFTTKNPLVSVVWIY